jgi:dsRNA-specific ribonuclease
MKKADPRLLGFLATQENEKDFKEYMRQLLSTFMPQEYLEIYMAENVMPLKPRPKEYEGLPELEIEPLGIQADRSIGRGPFYVIRRAFMHQFLSNINLETLETLGDVVLNEAVVMIITTAWPNLLKEAGQVADMKKFYVNNTNAARYAEKLGFLRWVVRLEKQGLNSKERADVFESFVGALTMIGEFYIGEQMGLAIARLFLNKFLATEDWYPDDPKYYETPANLWNDFRTALPADRPQPILKKSLVQDSEAEGGTGMWLFTVTIRDPEGVKNGVVKERTTKHVSKERFFAARRNKDDAKTAVYKELAEALHLSRDDINTMREEKRALNKALQTPLEELAAEGVRQGRKFNVPAKEPRGGQTFVFVEEITKEEVNGKVLTIKQTIAQGMGPDEKTALERAVKNVQFDREFETVAGTNFKIVNPDEEAIVGEEGTQPSTRSAVQPATTHRSTGRSFEPRGRGNKPHQNVKPKSAKGTTEAFLNAPRSSAFSRPK